MIMKPLFCGALLLALRGCAGVAHRGPAQRGRPRRRRFPGQLRLLRQLL